VKSVIFPTRNGEYVHTVVGRLLIVFFSRRVSTCHLDAVVRATLALQSTRRHADLAGGLMSSGRRREGDT